MSTKHKTVKRAQREAGREKVAERDQHVYHRLLADGLMASKLYQKVGYELKSDTPFDKLGEILSDELS